MRNHIPLINKGVIIFPCHKIYAGLVNQLIYVIGEICRKFATRTAANQESRLSIWIIHVSKGDPLWFRHTVVQPRGAWFFSGYCISNSTLTPEITNLYFRDDITHTHGPFQDRSNVFCSGVPCEDPDLFVTWQQLRNNILSWAWTVHWYWV